MFAALLITLRETLEAAIVVGIVLTFLTKTDNSVFKRYVWSGVGFGIIAALLLAAIIEFTFLGFSGSAEAVFEGVLMFITAGFITWMIMWVHRQKHVAQRIKERVGEHVSKGYGLGIMALVAASVWREGVETVLYLKSSSILDQSGQFIGAILGIAAAIMLAYILFRFALRADLSVVFNVTSVFLIMFAAGLVAHGVHEFQEVGVLPVFRFDPIINLTHILSHESTFGSFLRILFGYTSVPTLLETVSYAAFVVGIMWLKRFTDSLLLTRS